MTVELKPCPFCGSAGKELMERTTEQDMGRKGTFHQAHIECWNCGARGPSTAWYPSREGALKWLRHYHDDEGWNDRQEAYAQSPAADHPA